MGKSISANNLQELHSLTMMTCRPLPSYVPQPTRSVAPPRPPAVKGVVLAMLACGCAWLRSRFAPLTAVAALLLGRCRLRRNAGLCLTRGMRGLWREALPCPSRHPCQCRGPRRLVMLGEGIDTKKLWAPMKDAAYINYNCSVEGIIILGEECNAHR